MVNFFYSCILVSIKGVLVVISPVSYNRPVQTFKSSSAQRVQAEPIKKKSEVSYSRAVGVSAFLGTSAAGFTGIFCKMSTSLAVGLGVMGLALTFGIPDKMYRHGQK